MLYFHFFDTNRSQRVSSYGGFRFVIGVTPGDHPAIERWDFPIKQKPSILGYPHDELESPKGTTLDTVAKFVQKSHPHLSQDFMKRELTQLPSPG